MNSQSELLHIIALPLLREVGQKRAHELIRFFGSASAVFSASAADLARIPNISRTAVESLLAERQAALRRAQQELDFINRHQIRCYFVDDDDYPYRLRECADAPLLLYSKGNVDINKGKMVSVVGTRQPTERGKERCRRFVLELAARVPDITIVSGLAYGIDVTSHRAALEAGVPTIIIPGHGLDRIYPAVNRQVAVSALQNGGILTEFMSQTTPERPNFIARNRIIAGLADALVVVESKSKGGSLITAEMAFSYNRDVFAFAGRAEDEKSVGCNNLIKQQKAMLIDNADDLVKAMQWDVKQSSPKQTELFVELSEQEQQLLSLLRQQEDSMHLNSILLEMKLSFTDVMSLLFNLEMQGLIKALPGGFYRAVIG